MRKTPSIRFVLTLAVVAGAVTLSAVVAIVALARIGDPAGLGPLAWLLPLATLMVGCGIALIYVGDRARDRDKEPSPPRLCACPACGHEIGREWRLCPWCGDRVESGRNDKAA